MCYHQDYVNEWRAKAITKIEELIPGETYYKEVEKRPEGVVSLPIKIVRFLTTKESYQLSNTPTNLALDDEQLLWFECEYCGKTRILSLHDNNVGASYNPWLMFKDPNDNLEYYNNLQLWFEPDMHTYLHYWGLQDV
jgi:hypothetical protein